MVVVYEANFRPAELEKLGITKLHSYPDKLLVAKEYRKAILSQMSCANAVIWLQDTAKYLLSGKWSLPLYTLISSP